MSSKLYDIFIRIDERQTKLSTIVGALEGKGVMFEIRPVVEAEPTKAARTIEYAGGKRLKGIRGIDLVLEILTELKRPVSTTELSERFVARGFASNSVSPNVSRLLHEGKIVQTNRSTYVLKGTPIKFGATL